MKKFILFLGFFYLISFFACQEKNCKESFADIIKNDSSRKQELLDVAATLKDTRIQKDDSMNLINIDPKDELSPKELEDFRAKIRPRPDRNDKKDQTIIVSSQTIQELIGKNPGVKDSLIFYLGKYWESNRIGRYNVRNSIPGNPHDDNVLKHRITFAIQSKSETDKTITMSKVYDVGRLCPPPSTGCF